MCQHRGPMTLGSKATLEHAASSVSMLPPRASQFETRCCGEMRKQRVLHCRRTIAPVFVRINDTRAHDRPSPHALNTPWHQKVDPDSCASTPCRQQAMHEVLSSLAKARASGQSNVCTKSRQHLPHGPANMGVLGEPCRQPRAPSRNPVTVEHSSDGCGTHLPWASKRKSLANVNTRKVYAMRRDRCQEHALIQAMEAACCQIWYSSREAANVARAKLSKARTNTCRSPRHETAAKVRSNGLVR